MAFQIEIRVSPELIACTVPGLDLRRSFPNQVMLPFTAGMPPSNFATGGIRMFAGEDAQTDLVGLKQVTALLHRELARARPLGFAFAKLFHQFDYALWLEEGALLSLAPEDMADLLHVHLRMRRLSIDGRDVTIPLWRRNLEAWLRAALTFVLPLAMVLVVWQATHAIARSSAWLFGLALFAALYASLFAGMGLWLVLTRALAPGGYRKLLLRLRASRIGSGGLIARFWLRFLK